MVRWGMMIRLERWSRQEQLCIEIKTQYMNKDAVCGKDCLLISLNFNQIGWIPNGVERQTDRQLPGAFELSFDNKTKLKQDLRLIDCDENLLKIPRIDDVNKSSRETPP